MSDLIDKEFLVNNCFEQAKVGAGYFPWTYYDKRYDVVIAPITDGGYIYITVSNNETKESITFEKKKSGGVKLTKEDLHRCILFMGVPDEFEYGEVKR